MGMYFTAILAPKGNEHLRQLVLQQVDAIVRHNASEQDSEVALQHWMWDDADRSLLCMRYIHLKLTQQYLGAWRLLATAGIHGVHSLLSTEHDLLQEVRANGVLAMCCIIFVLLPGAASSHVGCSSCLEPQLNSMQVVTELMKQDPACQNNSQQAQQLYMGRTRPDRTPAWLVLDSASQQHKVARCALCMPTPEQALAATNGASILVQSPSMCTLAHP
jgi:hypothetical protein